MVAGGIQQFGHDIAGTTAQRPNNPDLGLRYFDTTINAPIWWNGSTWVQASSGAFDPISLGSSVKWLIDPNRAATMDFRPYRTISSANLQYFSRTSAGSADPFSYNGGGTSRMTGSMWFTLDTDTIAAWSSTSVGLIGKVGSWGWTLTTNGPRTSANLSFDLYTGNSGAYVGSKVFTNCLLLSGNYTGRCPHHLWWMYDGNQHGTDANVLIVYLDGQLLTTSAGTTLNQQLGTWTGTTYTAAGSYGIANAGLSIGLGSGNGGDMSFNDIVLCADVPTHLTTASTAALAAADMWKGGEGRRYPDMPASMPPAMAAYAGDDNYNDNGTAPSGNMKDLSGNGYDVTAVAAASNPLPTGRLGVINWRDVTGAVTHKFGYNPTTRTRQRLYEGEYSPTIRGGKPGVLIRGQRAGGQVANAYAYGVGAFSDLFGDGGSVFFNGMASQAIANAHNAISFCDDVTNRGNGSHGIRRAWGPTIFGQNHSLKQSNNRLFLSLQINDTIDGSATAAGLPSDFQGFNGNENLGLPFGSYLISAIVAGNAGTCKLTVAGHPFTSGQRVTVGVESGSGTTEVAGDWYAKVLNANQIEVYQDSGFTTPVTFVHAFTAGDGATTSYSWVMDKATADITNPGLNTVFSFECCNKNDGTDFFTYNNPTTYFNTAGVYDSRQPFEFYCGTQQVPFYLDTGQTWIAGHAWSTWFNDSSTVPPTTTLHTSVSPPASPAKLTSVVLNGLSEVVSGSWHISGVNDFVYGPCAVTGTLTATQRQTMRNWFANN